PRRTASVAHAVDLRGLALAVVGRAVLLPIGWTRNRIARLPEIRRLRLIRHARNHAALLPVLDLPERIAAELEVIPLLIDREAAVAIDQNPVFHAADQIVQRYALLARLQRHVRHPLERHAAPRIRVA